MSKNLGVAEQRTLFVKGCKFIVSTVKKQCGKDIEFLGIDQSRGSTGYCLRKRDGTLEIDRIVPDGYGFYKVMKVEAGIRKILENSNPFIAMEGYAMNARFGREKAGELGGILRRLCFLRKRPLIVIAPLSLKSWVKAGTKDQVMMEVLDRYGIKISNNDMADAFIIQEILHKMYLLANVVVKDKITPDEVRVYLRDSEYEKETGKLFRYQESSIFRIIFSQGQAIKIWSKKGDLKYEEERNKKREERERDSEEDEM